MTQRITITRKIEFDAGHRIPDHGNKCRHIHGHRYVLEASVTGSVIEQSGNPENGMVVDFANLKNIMMEVIGEPWDHAFLVYQGDHDLLKFLNSIPGHRTIVLDHVPTAENLVSLAAQLLSDALQKHYADRVWLEHLRLYETPNCWADYHSQ